MLSRARRRLAVDQGFTLIELLMSISIGTIVMLALFTLVDQAMPAQTRISDRTEAQQRARTAIDRITRPFRSAVCVPSSTGALLSPLLSADGQQITFFSYVTNASDVSSNAFEPVIRQIVYDPAANTLTRKTWGPWWGNPIDLNVAPPDPTVTSPDKTETLLTNVSPSGDANKNVDPSAVFGYFTPDGTTALAPANIGSNLDLIDRLRVGITVGPARASSYTGSSTTLVEDATLGITPSYVNGVAQGGPQCEI
jgi:prepilin-type N-terminal cleavage/methylation domain-containing protein